MPEQALKQGNSAAFDGDGNTLFPKNDGSASDSSSRTLTAENMDDDVESVTSGELLFTGTARLGSGKFAKRALPQQFFEKGSGRLIIRVCS